MMSKETTHGGERMSFYGLFAEHGFRIEIPKIQRDYAQGRPKQEAVRTKFLSAIFAYLEAGKPNRDLDFIYGNISSDQAGRKVFIPLDGQQRLTTLFLLHWYLAQSEKRGVHLKSFLRDNDSSRFTYETRSSSREFCNALMTEEIAIDWSSNDSIAEWIRDQGWYFTFWDNDPTVSSMLEMLDDIHGKFKGKKGFYEQLVDDENPTITFQFLNLDEFHLTDDLYIKMNSRGKPLTAFENFKAKFEGEIDLLFEKITKSYKASWLENNDVSPSEYFSFKIDTEWLGHFWTLSESQPKKVDGYLMNFIRTILTAWYSGNSSVKNKEDDNRSHLLQVLLGTRNIDEQTKQADIDFYVYDKIGCITSDSVTELIAAFDVLMNLDQEDINTLPKYQFNVSEIQKKVIEGTLLNQERLLFHAFIQYLIHHGNDLPSIGKWMRVAFNLIENTRVEFEQLIGGIDELNKLIPTAPNILETLCQTDNRISSFYSQQVIEERIKAHLMLKAIRWKNLIVGLEKDEFNRGQIGFLLEFSGIWEYYQQHGNCDWDSTEDDLYFEQLETYGSKASAVLPHLQKPPNESNLWERAVLTKGDYLIPTTANRFNLLNSTHNLRDYGWKRFLRLNPKTDQNHGAFADRRAFVKQVFYDVRFDVADPWNSLKMIISDGTNDWRNHFIEEPKLISNCNEGFIRFEDDRSIKIFRKKQLNSYHYELYTYAFYWKYLKDKSFKPIGSFKYEKGYGWDLPCYIFSPSWKWDSKSYRIRIYFSKELGYELLFARSAGDRTDDDYADEMREIASKLEFEFVSDESSPDRNGYYHTSNDEKKVIESLKSLCTELNQLLQ